MDKDGNSLETLGTDVPKASPDWPSHLERCAAVIREVAKMTALPHNTKRLNYVANDLELLSSQMRHPSARVLV